MPDLLLELLGPGESFRRVAKLGREVSISALTIHPGTGFMLLSSVSGSESSGSRCTGKIDVVKFSHVGGANNTSVTVDVA